MSKPKKKVVVTTTTPTQKTGKPTPTVSRTTTRTRQTVSTPKAELLFQKQNYIWMGIGALLIAIGFVLMSGGHMPSPDVWEPNVIYSFRRITLAPIMILIGLIVEIYAIFKK